MVISKYEVKVPQKGDKGGSLTLMYRVMHSNQDTTCLIEI